MHYKGAKENIWLVFITRGVNFKQCSINIFCLTNKNTENCKQFFHVTAYWLFINRSSDLSLIMQMWFMTILPTHNFPKKIESVQYNAALAITGTIKGSFSWKIVPEIKTGIFLSKKMGARRLCLLYKVFSAGHPSYIYDLLPSMRSFRRHVNSFNMVSCKSEFKNSFNPNVINEWNKLDPSIRSSTSYNLFRNTLLKFISPLK